MTFCKLFVFRHSETVDNSHGIFSGWRDPDLTLKGLAQAQEIANQLRLQKIDYAFSSHLRRARKTLEIVLKAHPSVPIFVDDRLIERCYGLLQGRSKIDVAKESPGWFAQIHRGYDFPPPEGESLKMVEKRAQSFVVQLEKWLQEKPGNVAISCHNNSLRPIRRIFEHLSLSQMLQIENPHDRALNYALKVQSLKTEKPLNSNVKTKWRGIRVPPEVKLATDPRNRLKEYY